jgi:hypothetical protein
MIVTHLFDSEKEDLEKNNIFYKKIKDIIKAIHTFSHGLKLHLYNFFKRIKYFLIIYTNRIKRKFYFFKKKLSKLIKLIKRKNRK